MDLTLPALMAFARDTVADPRAAARRVMAIPAPLADRWLALTLTAVVSTVLLHLGLLLVPMDQTLPGISPDPFGTLVMQGVVLVMGVMLTWRIGQARGGVGSLPDTISLMAWLQFVLLFLQAAQLVAQLLLPPLAMLLGFAGIGLFFWLFTQFVMELHGFRSPGATFAGILGVMMALGMVLALAIGPPTV